MAFDKKPSTFFGAGYASSSGSHTITLNTNDAASNKTLEQLTDVEADPTTGDWRKMVFAIMDKLATEFESIADADKPAKVTIAKTSRINSTTGIITNVYTVTCINDLIAQDVADEV